LQIAVFESFVEFREFTAPNTPHPHCLWAWRVEILSFIDLAAAVNTCNLEGMPTFNV